MDVKEAVDLAKKTVADLFAKEGVANLGLEEVVFDEVQKMWQITVGFSRAWDLQGALAFVSNARRTYKIVTIDPEGKAVSIKNRETANAE